MLKHPFVKSASDVLDKCSGKCYLISALIADNLEAIQRFREAETDSDSGSDSDSDSDSSSEV